MEQETIRQETVKQETVKVMGAVIRRSPVSSVCEPLCDFLKNGFCKTCTCTKCERGYLIDEWRERQLQGDTTCGPRECDCRERARTEKRLEDAGLKALAERCTFASFRTEKDWQKIMKNKAAAYLAGHRNEAADEPADCKRLGFFVAGQSGCGKTHLCVAICNEIIAKGGQLRYFCWVEDGTHVKQCLRKGEGYEEEIQKLIEADYLYIDDLFKQAITEADLRLAFEIINSRYNDRKPTIISSERTIEYIRGLPDDRGQAIAGRIFEGCGRGKYCLQLSGEDKDMRFRRPGPASSPSP